VRALPGVELVGEVGDARELAAVMNREQPDVVIVDDRLVEQVCATGIPPSLIVVGVDDDPGFAARDRRVGATAWVAKDQADTALPALLSSVPVLTPL
jgi:AmiR/NasT family two-component response regulator